MSNSNPSGNHGYNNDDNNNQILNLVKDALEEANLLDHLFIEERKEGYMLKPRINDKNEQIKTFAALAGSAVKAGENVDDLINMGKREEKWTSEEVE